MTNNTRRFKFYESHELREVAAVEMAEQAKKEMR